MIDGLRIVNVSDSSMRVWSPECLVRKDADEDNDVGDDAVEITAIQGQTEAHRTSRITALCPHPSLPIVFAGKFSGEIITFNTRTGRYQPTLYAHAHSASITTLTVNSANVVASSDSYGTVQVWNLNVGKSSVINSGPLLLQLHLPTRILQLCFSPEGDHILIATERSDLIYSTKDGLLVGTLEFDPRERDFWRWVSTTNYNVADQFVLLNDHKLQSFSVENFPSEAENSKFHLHYELAEGSHQVAVDSAVIHDNNLILEICVTSGYIFFPMMFVFDLRGGQNNCEDLVPLKPLNELLPVLSKRFIGVSNRAKAIIFLHEDNWISSTTTKGLSENWYLRHFFLPNDYVTASSHVRPVRTVDDGIVFCLHGELVVVKNGLSFQETQSLEGMLLS